MDYSNLEFDEEKYYLGTLCYRGHDWNNTGRSLRYIDHKDCLECINARYHEKARARGIKKKQVGWTQVYFECARCGTSFGVNTWDRRVKNDLVGLPVYCSVKCSSRSLRPRVSTTCAQCGSNIEVIQSAFGDRNFCNKVCKTTYFRGENCHFYIHGECIGDRTSEYKLKWKHKNKYWKGVLDIIRSKKAPSIVVIKAMDIMDEFTTIHRELHKLYREKKWREYIMKVNQLIDEHGEHLSALISGEVRYPQFRIRDINKAANTHLGVLREKRKEVVTNAFNHPDQIPTLIEL